MKRLIVDTSAYSAFMRGHDGVTATLRQAESLVLNPVILGELRAGFLRGAHRRKNEHELDRFVASPRVLVLGIDEDTAERYALIVDSLCRAGTPIPTNDVWIAASAMQHGLGVLTTDDHFTRVGQVAVVHHTVTG